MINGNPITLEEAMRKAYCGPRQPVGSFYGPERCAFTVAQRFRVGVKQCSRRPGHGPANLYCKQHARMVKP